MKEATMISTTLFIVAAVAVAISLALVVSNNSWLVFAQQTNTSSSTLTMKSGLISNNNTIIGNTIIPTTTNGTTTTAKNATGVNATGANPALLASNVTAANAFTKGNTTAPVSPTGISTNAAHVPPSIKSNTTGSR
jgi:hypothetical protein